MKNPELQLFKTLELAFWLVVASALGNALAAGVSARESAWYQSETARIEAASAARLQEMTARLQAARQQRIQLQQPGGEGGEDGR